MESLLIKIGSIIVAGMMTIGSIFSPVVVQAPFEEDLNVGATLPQATGVFETTLQAPITSTATSMTLSSNAVRGGGAVSGYTCFTVDEGSAQAEVICGTVSGTAVTSMLRGISYSDGVSEVAANQFAHRRGANVKITDFPIIQILKAQNNGDATFPNAIEYASGVGPTDSSDLADKEYVLSVVSGGAVSFEKVIQAGIAGETVAAGNLVYYKTSDSRWWKTDADTASTVENVVLGIAQGSGTAGNAITGGVLKEGIDSNQSGLSANTIYYASNTAGGVSSSAGTKEVTVGFAPSTTTLVFAPRYNQQITEDLQDALAGSDGTPSNSNKFATETGLTAYSLAVTDPVMRVYTGDGTWTKPSNLEYIIVEVVGGGGGGGGSTTGGDSCGGGGGGGYSREILAVASLAATEDYDVGAAGTAGADTGGDGGTGGTSNFGTTPFLQATGGAGGACTSLLYHGGAGGTGSNGTYNSVGGGGGAGSISAANTYSIPSGAGGSSVLGGGAQGKSHSNSDAAGAAGGNYGGGGSGAYVDFGGGGNTAGGVGAAGVVIVWEYYYD